MEVAARHRIDARVDIASPSGAVATGWWEGRRGSVSKLRCRCHNHFTSGRADLTAMKTTIWRPNVRVTLNEYGEVEDTEQEGEVVTKKGTKRKKAPPTKGPCEHGVKYRSNCKVCSACPHGRRRSRCKECGGSQICEHGRERSVCKECGGGTICEHGRQRSQLSLIHI